MLGQDISKDSAVVRDDAWALGILRTIRFFKGSYSYRSSQECHIMGNFRGGRRSDAWRTI